MSKRLTRSYCEKHHEEKIMRESTRRWACHSCEAAWQAKRYLSDPRSVMLSSARQRAASRCVPFNITKDDIIIPKLCPVFGILLKKGKLGDNPNAPSLDCIIPSLGYVVGNIAVISQRANYIKSNATLDELVLIVAWLRSQLNC